MELVLRATVIYFFLWLVSRAVGRRELSELSAFELMMLVIIGDLVQQGVTQSDNSVTGAMLVVGTIACWTVIASYAAFRWKKVRPAIDGVAVAVIIDGHIIDEALRIERVSTDELLTEARNQGIDDVRDIRVALIEADGRFSFIKYDGEQQQPQERRGS